MSTLCHLRLCKSSICCFKMPLKEPHHLSYLRLYLLQAWAQEEAKLLPPASIFQQTQWSELPSSQQEGARARSAMALSPPVAMAMMVESMVTLLRHVGNSVTSAPEIDPVSDPRQLQTAKWVRELNPDDKCVRSDWKIQRDWESVNGNNKFKNSINHLHIFSLSTLVAHSVQVLSSLSEQLLPETPQSPENRAIMSILPFILNQCEGSLLFEHRLWKSHYKKWGE